MYVFSQCISVFFLAVMQVIAPPSILPAQPAKDLGFGSSQEIGRNSIRTELFEFCMTSWNPANRCMAFMARFRITMDKQDALNVRFWVAVPRKKAAKQFHERVQGRVMPPGIRRIGSGRLAVHKPEFRRSCRSAWTGSGSWPRSAVGRSPRESCPRWLWPQSGGVLWRMERGVG